MNHITIRPLVREDAEKIVAWRNSPEIRSNLYVQDELTVEQHLWYFDNVVRAGKVHQFIIQVNGNWDIGTIFLKSIDHNLRKAEFGIFIGEPNARGKGFSSPAISQILQYGFEVLDLHRIYLSVIADNLSAVAAYEHMGFSREGTLKDDFLRPSGYVDVIIMGMLRDTWYQISRKQDKIHAP